MRTSCKSPGKRPSIWEEKTAFKSRKASTKRALDKCTKRFHERLAKGEKVSKKEMAQLNAVFLKEGKEASSGRRKLLVKKLPTLKLIKQFLDRKTYDGLVNGILGLLDDAIEEGFYDAPSGGSTGGSSGRSDTWSCPPGTHGVSCPCVQPSIPGPSGLS